MRYPGPGLNSASIRMEGGGGFESIAMGDEPQLAVPWMGEWEYRVQYKHRCVQEQLMAELAGPWVVQGELFLGRTSV